MEVSRDGKTLLTGGPGGIAAYDAATLAGDQSNEDARVAGLALSPDGRHLAYGLYVDSSSTAEVDPVPVRLMDPATLEPTPGLGGFMPGTYVEGAFAFSADGARLAAGLVSLEAGANAGVQVWDLQRRTRPVRTVPLDGVRLRVALSPEGDVLYAATRGPDVLRSYDVRTGKGSEVNNICVTNHMVVVS